MRNNICVFFIQPDDGRVISYHNNNSIDYTLERV